MVSETMEESLSCKMANPHSLQNLSEDPCSEETDVSTSAHDSDKEGEEEFREEESYSDNDDESDYEYEYIEEDDHEREIPSRLLSTKRKAPPTDSRQPNNSSSLPSSMTASFPSCSSSAATNLRGLQFCRDQETCRLCGMENHSPVASCQLAQQWTKGEIDDSISSSGITTWSSDYLRVALFYRAQECAERWERPLAEAQRILQRHGWNVAAAGVWLEGLEDEDNGIGIGIRHNREILDENHERFRQNRRDAHREFLESTVRESTPKVAQSSEESKQNTDDGGGKPKATMGAGNSANGAGKKFLNKLLACGFCDNDDDAEDDTVDVKKSATKIPAEAVIKRTCGICMEEFRPNELAALGFCHHHFYCLGCWTQYLESKFEGNFGGDRALQVTCPAVGCRAVVGERDIQKVAPDLIPRFEQHCLNAFVRTNRTFVRWCPGPGCNKIAIKPGSIFFADSAEPCQGTPTRGGQIGTGNGNTAVCGGKDGCQRSFCFLCGGKPHDGPCPEILHNQGVGQQQQLHRDGRRAIMAERVAFPQVGSDNNEKSIQRCPKCKSPVEKNGGCNHMTCKCGCHFCWLCNADITKEGYRHSCGREGGQGHNRRRPQQRRQREELQATNRPRDVNLDYIRDALEWKEAREKIVDTATTKTHTMLQNVLRMQGEMKHVFHYYNRFVAHNQGQEFAAGRCPCVRSRADEFTKISGIKSAADRDFLTEANMLLVSSRRLLKYSYCYVYQEKERLRVNAQDNDFSNTRLYLFQYHQEQLERFTEQLSEVSERAFNLVDRKQVLDLMEVVGRLMKAVIDSEIDHSIRSL